MSTRNSTRAERIRLMLKLLMSVEHRITSREPGVKVPRPNVGNKKIGDTCIAHSDSILLLQTQNILVPLARLTTKVNFCSFFSELNDNNLINSL